MSSRFGYDLAGQRVFERLRQKDLNTSTSRDDTHSGFYTYDALGRLTGERYGRLKTDGFDGIDHAAGPAAPLSLTYGLHELNRRVGSGSAPGISVWTDTDKDGVADAGEVSVQTHALDERGALTGLDDGSAVEPVGRDESGAVTELHGREIYHDWLGRPALALNPAGDAVFAVRYDGFGRVAQRRAPWPTDATKQRIESYFYDGVRRIQEVLTDPVGAVPPWPQPHGGGGGGGSTPETRTEAEYVWSAAGGGGQPFDTAHVQIDWWDREAWFIQDHQTGTVRAYTDPSGEVAEQYGFDAFGNLVRRDEFTLVKGGSQGYCRSFRQRPGHHGLFAKRVDGHTNQRVLTAGAGGEVWYQSRSRWYAPELGRFLSSDPNATGIPVVSGLAMLGVLPSGPPSGSFGWEAHYGDGWDTYTAYGANPINATDPTGLLLANLLGGLSGGFSISQHDLLVAGGAFAGVAAISAGVVAYQDHIENMLWGLGLAGGSLHISQSEAVQKAQEQVHNIEWHFGKLSQPPNPNDPRDHWKREIRTWINYVDRKTKHMKGKTKDEWTRRVNEWRLGLDRTDGSI